MAFVMKGKKGQPEKSKRTGTVARGKFAKAQVLNGLKKKTVGRLTKKDLKWNKKAKRIVSKKASDAAYKRSGKVMSLWGQSVLQARKDLKTVGFVPVGGTSRGGKALYKRAKQLFDASRARSPSKKGPPPASPSKKSAALDNLMKTAETDVDELKSMLEGLSRENRKEYVGKLMVKYQPSSATGEDESAEAHAKKMFKFANDIWEKEFK